MLIINVQNISDISDLSYYYLRLCLSSKIFLSSPCLSPGYWEGTHAIIVWEFENLSSCNMGPYRNRKFGQVLKKSTRPSSHATRYQRQLGNNNNITSEESKLDRKAAEAATRRRLRQEQGENIDIKFGFHRLEDQYRQHITQQFSSNSDDVSAAVSRRGWLFHMLATTVSIWKRYTCAHRHVRVF
jgi:hypothetical protein